MLSFQLLVNQQAVLHQFVEEFRKQATSSRLEPSSCCITIEHLSHKTSPIIVALPNGRALTVVRERVITCMIFLPTSGLESKRGKRNLYRELEVGGHLEDPSFRLPFSKSIFGAAHGAQGGLRPKLQLYFVDILLQTMKLGSEGRIYCKQPRGHVYK